MRLENVMYVIVPVTAYTIMMFSKVQDVDG